MRLELTVLGTASQAPTRDRGQGGCVLRWGRELVLFDPGEGCQRQMLLAGVSAARVTRVCITHFHGDHCLGLPGFLQSRALTTSSRITLHYLADSADRVEHLLAGSEIDFDLRVDHQPVTPADPVETDEFVLTTALLDHPTPSIGYRLEAPISHHLVADRLDALGLDGDQIGELVRTGLIEVAGGCAGAHPGPSGPARRALSGRNAWEAERNNEFSARTPGRPVSMSDVSEIHHGPAVAFIMDTAPCEGARRLADAADLLICESTYLSSDADLAHAHGHMTASDAARLAADAQVGTLVLTHYSSRYDDERCFQDEAARIFPEVVAATDLACISVQAPSRPAAGAEVDDLRL